MLRLKKWHRLQSVDLDPRNEALTQVRPTSLSPKRKSGREPTGQDRRASSKRRIIRKANSISKERERHEFGVILRTSSLISGWGRPPGCSTAKLCLHHFTYGPSVRIAAGEPSLCGFHNRSHFANCGGADFFDC